MWLWALRVGLFDWVHAWRTVHTVRAPKTVSGLCLVLFSVRADKETSRGELLFLLERARKVRHRFVGKRDTRRRLLNWKSGCNSLLQNELMLIYVYNASVLLLRRKRVAHYLFGRVHCSVLCQFLALMHGFPTGGAHTPKGWKITFYECKTLNYSI